MVWTAWSPSFFAFRDFHYAAWTGYHFTSGIFRLACAQHAIPFVALSADCLAQWVGVGAGSSRVAARRRRGAGGRRLGVNTRTVGPGVSIVSVSLNVSISILPEYGEVNTLCAEPPDDDG